MKSYITAILAASAIAHGAFSEVVTVDLNTKPEEKITYDEGYYYFDLTDVSPDQEYKQFPNVNREEEGVIIGTANALFEIGSNSQINFEMWEFFNALSATENSYTSNEEFTGIVWKFDMAEDGSTGYISNKRHGGFQNSQIQGLKLFDFTDFDTSKSVEHTQEIFNLGFWSSFNNNSSWEALIAGTRYDLQYNGTVTIETDEGIFEITLTESDTNTSPNEEEGDFRKLEYSLSFSSNVPEPATYAAVLGALALGFAVYRRRK